MFIFCCLRHSLIIIAQFASYSNTRLGHSRVIYFHLLTNYALPPIPIFPRGLITQPQSLLCPTNASPCLRRIWCCHTDFLHKIEKHQKRHQRFSGYVKRRSWSRGSCSLLTTRRWSKCKFILRIVMDAIAFQESSTPRKPNSLGSQAFKRTSTAEYTSLWLLLLFHVLLSVSFSHS